MADHTLMHDTRGCQRRKAMQYVDVCIYSEEQNTSTMSDHAITKVVNEEKLCGRIYSEEQNTFATMSDHTTTREVANEEKLCGPMYSEEQNTIATMSNDAPQNVSKNPILATFAGMRLRVKKDLPEHLFVENAYEN